MRDERSEQREADAAAAEAGAIGGSPSDADPLDPPAGEAQRPLAEAGQGESEGFEQSEAELIDHAAHGDQHAAHHVIGDAAEADEDARAGDGGDGDAEHSSARADDR